MFFFNKNKLSILFSSATSTNTEDNLFENIYGYDNLKRLLRMATFIDCSNATKSGLVDCIFDNKPKYLLLDELDKLSRKDQAFL
jgi:hypothetical protein